MRIDEHRRVYHQHGDRPLSAGLPDEDTQVFGIRLLRVRTVKQRQLFCRIRHIERVNEKLNHWEQIRQWTLIGDELTVESGLLTPTLKIRRTVAEARYAEKIEKMYEN